VACQDVDALALERALELAPEVGIHPWQQRFCHLDDRHARRSSRRCTRTRPRPHRRPTITTADGAARLERLAAREDDDPVDVETGERALAAAGRDEDVPRGEPRRLGAVRRDRDPARNEPPSPGVVGDAVLLAERRHALRLTIRHLAAPLDHARVVDRAGRRPRCRASPPPSPR
jgi:hypothetical protein